MTSSELSNPIPRTPREIRDWHIYDLTGIDSDLRDSIPLEETKQLVHGAQAGDPEAQQRLLATRIGWVYDKYMENEVLEQREDYSPADILQAGIVAILEAAKVAKLDDIDAPNFYQQFATDTRRIIAKEIMGGKLLPTIGEGGRKLTDARSNREEKRMLEGDGGSLVLPGDSEDVAAIAVEDKSEVVITPEEAAVDVELPELVTTAMGSLDEAERAVIEARFGLGEFEGVEGLSLEAVGERLGLNRETARQTEIRALDTIREVCEELTKVPGPRWTKEQLALQEKWLKEIKSREAAGKVVSIARRAEGLREEWLTEIRAKQAAGKIAFVTGGLLERPLPGPIALHLLTDYEGEAGTPSLDFEAAIRDAAEEEFRVHRLTSVAA